MGGTAFSGSRDTEVGSRGTEGGPASRDAERGAAFSGARDTKGGTASCNTEGGGHGTQPAAALSSPERKQLDTRPAEGAVILTGGLSLEVPAGGLSLGIPTGGLSLEIPTGEIPMGGPSLRQSRPASPERSPERPTGATQEIMPGGHQRPVIPPGGLLHQSHSSSARGREEQSDGERLAGAILEIPPGGLLHQSHPSPARGKEEQSDGEDLSSEPDSPISRAIAARANARTGAGVNSGGSGVNNEGAGVNSGGSGVNNGGSGVNSGGASVNNGGAGCSNAPYDSAAPFAPPFPPPPRPPHPASQSQPHSQPQSRPVEARSRAEMLGELER